VRGRVPYTAAAVLAHNDTLEARLRHVETKPVLDLDAIDAAIRHIRRPDVVRQHIGDALLYAQRVEAEVGGLSIETLLPHTRNDYVGRFLHVWVPDEQGHGEAQAHLSRHLGLRAYEPRPEDAVPLHNRAAGFLARLLPRVKSIIEMTYHTIGAINERLALEAYRRMATILDQLGEHEVAKALMVPMRNDEAAHLSYYRTYARQLRPSLATWQLAVVRALIVHTYAPVGAGKKHDKAPLGRALLQLESDPDDPGIATSIQAIAQELLADGGTELRPFVRASLQKCVHLARQAAA
jgi:hypothetical protein